MRYNNKIMSRLRFSNEQILSTNKKAHYSLRFNICKRAMLNKEQRVWDITDIKCK